MSESPIELGPCEITITRSDGSREIIEAVNASVKLTNKPNESRDTVGVDRTWRTIAEVFPQFGYKSLKAAKNAVAFGCFPVETYLLAGRRVVDVEVMQAFFQKHRETGLKKLEKRIR